MLTEFTGLKLTEWSGLPRISLTEIEEVYGKPLEIFNTTLGAFPAKAYKFNTNSELGNLIIYQRGTAIVMAELETYLDGSLLKGLDKPSVVLPQELSIEGAYAHEYLYCNKGLLITVLQYLDKQNQEPDKIIRIRTFKSIKEPRELKSELYYPLDAREKWS